MAAVRLRIEARDDVLAGFPIALIEDGVETARDVLLSTAMTAGAWMVPLRGISAAAPGRDLIDSLATTDYLTRAQIDWSGGARAVFDWLVPGGPLRRRWMQIAVHTPELYLEVADDDLAAVPWELACSAAPERRPALINGLSRLRASQPGQTSASDWPMRVLVVVGCASAEEATLGIADEIKHIERRFLRLGRSVDVHCLWRPDKTTLAAHIRRFPPHVLHFAGHGSEDPLTGMPGLGIETHNGPWVWQRDDVVTDVALWNWVPRFIFLNACRSAVGQTGTLSVQRSFLDAGAVAVLAMQADVRGDLAGRFAADLYDMVAQGQTVQQAVRDARVNLAQHLNSYTPIDWALPSLTATQEALMLFRPREIPTAPEFEHCREFEEARYFANCRAERRALTHWMYPAVQPAAPMTSNVLVLNGPAKSGKSHLLKWCMETWAIGGTQVRYIELDKGVSRDFLSVIRQIREGDSDGSVDRHFLHQPLRPASFRRFNWELNNRLATGQPGEWHEARHPEAVIPDGNAAARAVGEQRLEPGVCASFLEALTDVAASQPLILVFDRLGGPRGERLVDPTSFEQLVLHLFRPIAETPSSRIRLVFSVTKEERADYKLHLLPAARIETCDLPHHYSDADLVPLAAEMLWFADETDITDLAKAVFRVRRTNQSRVGLGRLWFVLDTIRDDQDRLAQVRRMR